MNPFPPYSTAQTHWFQGLPPNLPPSSSFWETNNVGDRLMGLQETLSLAKAMKKELEMLMVEEKNSAEDSVDKMRNASTVSGFYEYMRDRKLNLEFQRPLSIKAANSLMLKLRSQLDPFMVVSNDSFPWEDKSASARLSNKIQKSRRNKLWRKRKRKRTYRMLAEENKQFDQADQEANEWIAREIAKDTANSKVEKMKEIAKRKAKEEKKILEKELELVVIVEKLQELRSIRIQKLKKQGHFFPEEDDKFLKKVEAAVEEEERQAKEAAKESTGSGKAPPNKESSKDAKSDKDKISEKRDETHRKESEKSSDAQSGRKVVEEQGSKPYDTLTNLPIEFYHYYHGSSTDMGTLIEVRRTWDAYIRPGGSRISGHWVQPSPPSDEIWASYLIKPKRCSDDDSTAYELIVDFFQQRPTWYGDYALLV